MVREAVFKYLGAQPNHLDVLRNLKIRFSQPSALNDPLDCIPSISPPSSLSKFLDRVLEKSQRALTEISEEQFREAKQSVLGMYSEHPSILVDKNAEYFREKLEEIGVLSLGDRRNNMALWAHYAEEHRGFVVEFNSGYTPFIKKEGDINEEGVLRKVLYRETRAEFSLDCQELPPDLLHIKRRDWEYEGEIRMVRRLINCDSVIRETGVHLWDLDPRAVVRIDIGHAASEELIEELKRIIWPNSPLEHVELYQCHLDSSPDGIKYERLSIL